MPSKLFFVVNDPAFFLSHRLPIARAAKDAGYDVHVATSTGVSVDRIATYDFKYHELPVSRSGKNPFSELQTLLVLLKLFRQVAPDIVHLITVKPVIYGGILARLTKTPAVVAAISGLGFAFIRKGFMARIIRYAIGYFYRIALGHNNIRVIFQNNDDARVISSLAVLMPEQVSLIRGSGVDLQSYVPKTLPEGCPVVMLAARLLVDKGCLEFVEAARILRQRVVKARFVLVGIPDPGNPASLTQKHVARWVSEGLVEDWGYRQDMPEVLVQAALVVLPSYREGLPKVLIEAQACGRAVVTTDVPGCRDAITPDVTGLLVPPRDVVALADAIETLLCDRNRLQTMGEAGRAWAEKCFDVRQVVAEHLDIYRELLQKVKGDR
ncbi:glycosyl transferase [Betaproteobacteria bacterium]|nr:glycosyl transferase [Betaproteobacteria bacterium]